MSTILNPSMRKTASIVADDERLTHSLNLRFFSRTQYAEVDSVLVHILFASKRRQGYRESAPEALASFSFSSIQW